MPYLGRQRCQTSPISASVFTAGECAIQRLAMLAGNSRHPRGRLEEIQPLRTFPRFWSTKTFATAPTQPLTSVYIFGAVSLFSKNSSSRPAPCFLLSEQTKRYTVHIVPEAKSDAEFVHQLSTTEASCMGWSYVIMRSENAAQLVLYGTFTSTKAIE